jgi:hypothetical protein
MTTGQVPETIMTGDTADISHIADFTWFNWIMFQDNVPDYPDGKETLGHYLGLAIDMAFALTAKILKPNGKFVCRTTLRHLNDTELQSSVHLNKQQQIDTSIGMHLGPVATAQDFDPKDLTPDPAYFDNTHVIDPDYGNAKITHKMGDNYFS